jgi:outer membrane protein assembly factor BamA
LFFIFVVLVASAAVNREALGDETGAAASADSTEEKTSGYLFLPVLFYTPETELAVGASVVRYFRSDSATAEARPSKIWTTLIFTQRSQYIADLFNELYFDDEKYLVVNWINYQKFPDKFYGVGPNTPDLLEEAYTPKTFSAGVRFQRRITGGLNAGIRYEFQNTDITETTQGGLLETGVIPGSEGGVVSGVGAMVNWDTRNNIFYPTAGSYHRVSVSSFGNAVGSDFDFTKYVIDLREYISLNRSAVLAMRGLLDSSSGVVPFWRLAQLGGQDVLRGYYQGRYRDLHALAGQIELRMGFWWRMGVVAFAGAGNVANRLNHFNAHFIRYSGGFGIRYRFDEKEAMNIRLDFGYGEDTSGIYITALEAF